MSKFEAGLMTWTDHDAVKPSIECPTVQCVHCGGHFPLKPPKPIVVPLSQAEARAKEVEGKKTRGFCQNCNGYFCGPDCAACVHVEQLLENIEKGRELDFRPIVSKPFERTPNGGQIWMPPPLPTSAATTENV